MIVVLALIMRQKIISLSLDTYELASKKANFSAWVRRKLMEEVEIVPIDKVMYGSYCLICETTYQNSTKFLMESHYCRTCNERCSFIGVLE